MPEVPSGSRASVRPPLHKPSAAGVEDIRPGDDLPECKGEAAYTIPGECERLFCDTLSAVFLGERELAGQESLGMGAYHSNRSEYTNHEYEQILAWIEVWDYTSDTIYRGFVTDMEGERTMFVFFADGVLEHGLKSGYTAHLRLLSYSNTNLAVIG